MGKYLHEFQNDSAFQSFISSDSYVEPFVSSTNMGNDEWRIDYNQDNGGGDEYLTMPLTFEITAPGDINWVARKTGFTCTIEYSKNGGEWIEITSDTGSSAPTISVQTGDIVQFRGDNAVYCSSTNWNIFSGTCGFNLKGNIMSLIDSAGFATATTLGSERAFYTFFKGCTGLTDASNLKLPATTLASSCYYGMFRDCTSLTSVPELPATTLSETCYYAMFRGCTALTSVPSNYLPSTTLALSCYNQMFSQCSSLTTAPELLAPVLVQACYNYMFQTCTSLNHIKCLATDISATNCTAGWVDGINTNPGTFIKASGMEDWTRGANGIPNNWTVQDA